MKKMSIQIVLLFSSLALFSQKLNVWRGGAAGQPTDWNCAKNWSDGRVPNEFSDVVISDVSSTTGSMPILKTGDVEINSLTIESNALLTIEHEAKLTVLNVENGSLDLQRLILKGSILLLDEAAHEAFSAKNMAWQTAHQD